MGKPSRRSTVNNNDNESTSNESLQPPDNPIEEQQIGEEILNEDVHGASRIHQDQHCTTATEEERTDHDRIDNNDNSGRCDVIHAEQRNNNEEDSDIQLDETSNSCNRNYGGSQSDGIHDIESQHEFPRLFSRTSDG